MVWWVVWWVVGWEFLGKSQASFESRPVFKSYGNPMESWGILWESPGWWWGGRRRRRRRRMRRKPFL